MIAVMIVDDHPIVRDGIAALVETAADMRVVARAASAAEAESLFTTQAPDVTIMDLRLRDGSGADVIARIRRRAAQARFIVLTTYDGEEDIHRALAAGASAYLLKDSFSGEILQTIREVAAGGRRLPPSVARRLEERALHEPLTAREMEVLQRLTTGDTNVQIGEHLGIAPGTVKVHVERILGKMGVKDRTSAALEAVRRGLIRL